MFASTCAGEMKWDCNWDPSLMQSIASGEAITVSKKNAHPIKFKNTRCHLLMIGNVIPRLWAGPTEAITRRFPPIRFDKKLKVKDAVMKKRILNRGELIMWWLKTVMLYFEMSQPHLYGCVTAHCDTLHAHTHPPAQRIRRHLGWSSALFHRDEEQAPLLNQCRVCLPVFGGRTPRCCR